MGPAGEGEVVDVGAMGAGPLPHMMDLATITRHVATRRRAPTILGIQDNSLPGRGQAFGVIQSQRFAVVEDSEVMIRVAAQPDHI